jgi:D-threo-aldose 1-dehydrogenase
MTKSKAAPARVNPRELRRLGRSQVEVTALGLGGAALGNLYAAVSEKDAVSTVSAALEQGIRYLDTAPAYGYGLSERRIGTALTESARDDVVIATKVGWRLEAADSDGGWGIWADTPSLRAVMDFSPRAVKDSIEGSLRRLGVERVEILWIHDPDEAASAGGRDPDAPSHFHEAMESTYPILDRMRGEGTIGAIGVGLSQSEMLCEFAEAGEFDVFLLANRYTLLEQDPLRDLLPLCERKGISLVIGGAFNSGILATGAVEGARYDYGPAPADVLEKVKRLEAVCARLRVPLAAAALQFPLAHPAVASLIFGARTAAEVGANCRLAALELPARLWSDLKDEGLLDPAAPTPGREGGDHEGRA